MDLQEPHLLDRDPTSQHRRKLHLAGARSRDGVVLSGKAANVPFGGISDVPGPATLLGLVPGWPGSFPWAFTPQPTARLGPGPGTMLRDRQTRGTVNRGYPNPPYCSPMPASSRPQSLGKADGANPASSLAAMPSGELDSPPRPSPVYRTETPAVFLKALKKEINLRGSYGTALAPQYCPLRGVERRNPT
jgi:hypothetical protein